MGSAGTHCCPSRNFPNANSRRRRNVQHACGLRALFIPRKDGRMPYSPQRDGPGERHFRRRPGSFVCCRSTLMDTVPFYSCRFMPVAKNVRQIYNNWMTFGSLRPELMPGARNAIDTCLAIQPNERVTLIADRASAAVAASLAKAIAERGAICEPFLLEDR